MLKNIALGETDSWSGHGHPNSSVNSSDPDYCLTGKNGSAVLPGIRKRELF